MATRGDGGHRRRRALAAVLASGAVLVGVGLTGCGPGGTGRPLQRPAPGTPARRAPAVPGPMRRAPAPLGTGRAPAVGMRAGMAGRPMGALPPTAPRTGAPGAPMAPGPRWAGMGPRRAMLRAMASYLGMTPRALWTELRSGRTPAQIATARGKSVSGLRAAMMAQATQEIDAFIQHGWPPRSGTGAAKPSAGSSG